MTLPKENNMRSIYLDHNAHTPVHLSVRDDLLACLDLVGNPSSIHRFGRQVRGVVEESRYNLATFYNLLPEQVIFTSGATEACNLVIKSYPGPVLISSGEHDAVRRAFDERNPKHPCSEKMVCPIDHHGQVDLNIVEAWLKEHCDKEPLVSVIAVHNETGVIAPINALHQLCQLYAGRLFCDTTQAIGKMTADTIPLDFELLDGFVISGQKIGGVTGVGALCLRGKWPFLHPLIHGGGQERGMRGGSINTMGAIILAKAVIAHHQVPWGKINGWRQDIETFIKKKAPQATIVGEGAPRCANTINVTMPGVGNTMQLMHFDLAGIAVSAGAACSSGKINASKTLMSMGFNDVLSKEAIRVSLGWTTTQEEVNDFITCWETIYDTLHLS